MVSSMSKKASKSCCICKEIETHYFPKEYRANYPIRNRLCFESQYFVVFPSISPLVAGHTLVFPKKHVKNLMQLCSHAHEDLCETVQQVSNLLSAHFGSLYTLEHGVGEDNGTACGINHAHLHFIPMKSEVAKRVNNRVRKLYSPDISGPFHEILNQKRQKGSYLLFGQNLDYIHIALNRDIPSQVMRKVIAEELGNEKWDWKQLYGWKNFQKTFSSFDSLVSIKG